MKALKLTIILSFFCFCTYGQDTLVLCKIKDPGHEYKIPALQYNIKVKCKHRKSFRALVVSFRDSSIVFRKRQNNKQGRKKIKKIYQEAFDTVYLLKLENNKADSVMRIAKIKADEIEYPIEIAVNTAQIKKLKIDNRNRPEKKKLIKALDIATVSWILAFPISIAVTKGDPYVAVAAWSLGIVIIVADLIFETKRINFNKWAVKTIIKS